MKWIVALSTGKGIVLATIALAVIHTVIRSGLSPFAGALIIATVSATITGTFLLISSWLNRQAADQVVEGQRELKRDIEDVKGIVDATKRKSDKRV